MHTLFYGKTSGLCKIYFLLKHIQPYGIPLGDQCLAKTIKVIDILPKCYCQKTTFPTAFIYQQNPEYQNIKVIT